MNDLVDTVPEAKANDKLSLLYKSNELTKVAINTPFGVTDRDEFRNLVQQGGGWGGILCSNTVDTLEKKSPSNTKGNNCHPKPSTKSSPESYSPNTTKYLYKGIMPIPMLAYIDDINKVVKCGENSLESNTFITKQIEMKRLNFNVGNEKKKSKCQKLHVRKNKENCIPL